MALPAARVNECLGHVAVLIDHVGQMVELVAKLYVVRAPPTALEERHVLVELIVLIGVKQGKTAKVGCGGSARGLRQSGRQGIARIIYSLRASGIPHKVRSCGWPAKVVIVLKKVAEAGGRYDLWGQADVSADVVGRVRSRPAKAV